MAFESKWGIVYNLYMVPFNLIQTLLIIIIKIKYLCTCTINYAYFPWIYNKTKILDKHSTWIAYE